MAIVSVVIRVKTPRDHIPSLPLDYLLLNIFYNPAMGTAQWIV